MNKLFKAFHINYSIDFHHFQFIEKKMGGSVSVSYSWWLMNPGLPAPMPIPSPPLLPGNEEETGHSLQTSGASTRVIIHWGNLTKYGSHSALLHHTKLHRAWKLSEDGLYNTVTVFFRLPSWWLRKWTCISYCPILVLITATQRVPALGLELSSLAWPPFGCSRHSGAELDTGQ